MFVAPYFFEEDSSSEEVSPVVYPKEFPELADSNNKPTIEEKISALTTDIGYLEEIHDAQLKEDHAIVHINRDSLKKVCLVVGMLFIAAIIVAIVVGVLVAAKYAIIPIIIVLGVTKFFALIYSKKKLQPIEREFYNSDYKKWAYKKHPDTGASTGPLNLACSHFNWMDPQCQFVGKVMGKYKTLLKSYPKIDREEAYINLASLSIQQAQLKIKNLKAEQAASLKKQEAEEKLQVKQV